MLGEHSFLDYNVRLTEWLTTRKPPSSSVMSKNRRKKQRVVEAMAGSPAPLQLKPGYELREWQTECLQKWREAGFKGTVKVVTGAGKTAFAMAGMSCLQQAEPDLRVVIVVPTIVLQEQWLEEIMEWTNVPMTAISRQGGGYKEDISAETRILICVLDTAARLLPKLHEQAPFFTGSLLLVVDECHRAGSKQMRNIFQIDRKYSLGLSATPEREEESEDGSTNNESTDEYGNSLLGKEIGPIVYEMTMSEAYRMGLLPQFTLNHWGLRLTAEEGRKYDNLGQQIQDLRKKLSEGAGGRIGSLMAWVQSTAQKAGDLQGVAQAFISRTSERKRLLYSAAARMEAVRNIVGRHQGKRNFRMILFHESIAEVEQVFAMLTASFPQLRIVLEHSKVPDSLRAEGINLFRQGGADVIVSARSLIEGFNVPGADLAIIVASSTSVRQRIQSIGRVLRKRKNEDGSEKTAEIYVLYMQETVDTLIYEREDWDALIGTERNQYFVIDEAGNESAADGPPAKPLPKDVDIMGLTPGSIYPGRYEGQEYSCDTQRNIFDLDGRLATNSPNDLVEQIRRIKGSCGRFKVTPKQLYVLVQLPDGDIWKVYYVTRLAEPLDFANEQESEFFCPEQATTGQLVPRGWLTEKRQQEDLWIKQVKGELKIIRKQGRNEIWAQVSDETKALLQAARKLEEERAKAGDFTKIYKFTMVDQSVAVLKADSKVYFLARLTQKLSFA